jgi:Ca2+/Na+ antiporter
VIASTPSKLVLHINNISAICGASILAKVHHKHINTLTVHPVNPQTLLLEIALFPVNNWTQNSLNFILLIIYYANIRKLIWQIKFYLLYLPVEMMNIS